MDFCFHRDNYLWSSNDNYAISTMIDEGPGLAKRYSEMRGDMRGCAVKRSKSPLIPTPNLYKLHCR